MGNAEEYLDDLLNSLSGEEKTELEEEMENGNSMDQDDLTRNIADDITDTGDTSTTDEAFLKQFEEELSEDTNEDFLRQFEQELNEDGTVPESAETVSATDQAFLDDIDSILNGVKEETTKTDLNVSESAIDIPVIEPEPTAATSSETPVDAGTANEKSTEGALGGSDDELMALLSGLTEGEEPLDSGQETQSADVSGVMETSETEEAKQEEDVNEKASPEDLFGTEGLGENIFGEEDKTTDDVLEAVKKEAVGEDKKEKQKDKKNGFFQKLSLILFGEDEEEEDLSPENENLKLLEELDAAGETDQGAVKAKDAKEKKKKEKAEKKEQKKKEKEAKKAEKAQKAASKPKKEKKPKEKDNTPPLPKKPVILIAVMAISIFALVILGSNAVGYSVSKEQAREAYKAGDYVTAYTKLAGHEIKEKDREFYIKTGLLATLQEEYNAYQSMMSLNEHEMALDCLIRGIGRYNKNAEDAAKYGVAPEFNSLKDQMAQELIENFGVDEEQACAVYDQRGRTNYTLELKRILEESGME